MSEVGSFVRNVEIIKGWGVNVCFLMFPIILAPPLASLSVFHFNTDAIVCVFLLEGYFCYSTRNTVGLIKASSFIRGKSAPKGM